MRRVADAPPLTALRRAVAELMEPQGSRPGAPTDLPVDLVRAHGLGPLAYRAGHRRFAGDLAASAVEADRREAEVRRAVDVLDMAGVRVAPLKGISYARWLYHEPALRPMTDVDLLVPRESHRRARRALIDAGYRDAGPQVSRSSLHHAVTLVRDRMILDLHTSIVQPLRSAIDLDAIWSRTTAERSACGTHRLDPLDETLLHLTHVARHELMVPVIAYVDAARLLRLLDARQRHELLHRARRYRVATAVRSAVGMTAALARPTEPSHRRGIAGVMPSTSEVLERRPVRRPLQVLRKLALTDGPRDWLGLATVYVGERLPLRS